MGCVDPLAEVIPHLSPYHYANNNPIMYNDPTGMLSQSFIDQVWNSPHGTTWYNTGSGFVNNWGGGMDYDGHAMNWSTGYANSLLAGVGAGPAVDYLAFIGGGGGGYSMDNNVLSWWTGTGNIYENGQLNYNWNVLHVLKLYTQSENAWDKFWNYVNDHLYIDSELALDAGPQIEIKIKAAGIPVGINVEERHTEKFRFAFNLNKGRGTARVLMAEQSENTLGWGIGFYGAESVFSDRWKTVSQYTQTYGPIGYKQDYNSMTESVEWTPLELKLSAILGIQGKITIGWKF